MLSRSSTTDEFPCFTCDVADAAAVDEAFGKVEAELGRAAVVVSNAGVARDTLLVRMKDDDWRDVIDTSLTGAFNVARRAIPSMMKARWGRLVFMSSVAAHIGTPGQANYAAAKAGLIGFARSVAREYAGRGITANVVAPGPIDTDMTAHARRCMARAHARGRARRPVRDAGRGRRGRAVPGLRRSRVRHRRRAPGRRRARHGALTTTVFAHHKERATP